MSCSIRRSSDCASVATMTVGVGLVQDDVDHAPDRSVDGDLQQATPSRIDHLQECFDHLRLDRVTDPWPGPRMDPDAQVAAERLGDGDEDGEAGFPKPALDLREEAVIDAGHRSESALEMPASSRWRRMSLTGGADQVERGPAVRRSRALSSDPGRHAEIASPSPSPPIIAVAERQRTTRAAHDRQRVRRVRWPRANDLTGDRPLGVGKRRSRAPPAIAARFYGCRACLGIRIVGWEPACPPSDARVQPPALRTCWQRATAIALEMARTGSSRRILGGDDDLDRAGHARAPRRAAARLLREGLGVGHRRRDLRPGR